MNGIIIDGKVYEAVEKLDCDSCDFNEDIQACVIYCDICDAWGCAFRYSQTLTDKLNRE